MTQIVLKTSFGETIPDFLKRLQDESLKQKEFLKSIVAQRSDGLGLADLGAKIAFEEGQLKAITDIKLTFENLKPTIEQTNEVDLLAHEELEDPESRLARMESEGLVD